MSKSKLIETLVELLHEEHAGCEDNTCLINIEMLEQYPVHIGECFTTSGAASLKFSRVYKQLCRKYKSAFKRSTFEARRICKTVPHMTCGCNAVIWDQSGCYSQGDTIRCASCGTVHEFMPEGVK